MSHDEDDRSVEFVVGDDEDASDEDLADPVGFPRLRRARLPLLVAGAVVLVAAVAVNVAHGPSGTAGSRAAAPTVTVTPSASPPATQVVLEPGSQIRIPDLVTCPEGASCTVFVGTPASVTASLRHALPGVRNVQTTSTLEHRDQPGSQLVARRITARLGAAHLSVDVRPTTRKDELSWNASETPARTLVTVEDHVASRLVSLRLTAPPGYGVRIEALRRLAADAALTRLG